jgi:Pectinacetylesterase
MAELSRLVLGVVVPATTTLVGCGGSDSAEDSGGGLPKAGQLLTVEPGGDTICSRGTPFRFFVMGGDPKKIVIDFRGGGACWDAVTCSIADAIFEPEAPSEADTKAALDSGSLGGIYRLDKAENPVKGWTLVHIPYCTGDIHWGDAVVDYSPDVTIHHKGFVNATATLTWVYEHYKPEQILVTGCSAGAYGAIGHSVYVADHYPDAKITVVADSGCGIVTDTFFKQSFPKWNAQIPQIPGLAGKDITTLTIADLYTSISADYPNVRFAEQSSAFDNDQTFYYKAMGGQDTDWSPKMMQSFADIGAASQNFRYYMSPGPLHCLHPYDSFYTRASEGVPYTGWLSDMLNAATAPASVTCSATTCKQDPVCDACLAGTLDAPECSWCKGWTGQ